MKRETRPPLIAALLALLAPVTLLAQRDWVAHSGQLQATTFGANTYVVVGQYGLIFNSSDAVT